jgi:hypothetical protein
VDAAGVELEALAKREPAAEILSEAEGPVKANLVEAAGVEPASEKVTGQETTCLFAFMPRAFVALQRFPLDVRGLRSERTRNGCR